MTASSSIRVVLVLVCCFPIGCAEGSMGADRGEPAPDAGTDDGDGGTLVADAGPIAPPPADTGPPVPAGDCLPGLYVGTFTGTIAGMVSSGTVQLTLEAVTDGTGEFTVLVIRDGHVEGEAGGGRHYTADITGELDCEAGGLMEGRLENGTFAGFTWAGTTEARYDRIGHAFYDGTWTATAGSIGTWEATLQP